MARTFANVKVLSTLARRGYAATAQGATTTRGGGKASMSSKMASPKSIDEKIGGASEKVSWVPDPKTGYYKPENIKEIDVAELRATLLSKNH